MVEHFTDASGGGMFTPEIEAVMDALDAGLTQCPGHNHAESIRLAEIMDVVKAD